MEEYATLVTSVADILDKKENHQRILGEITSKIAELKGFKAIDEFAHDVEDIHGKPVPANTLKHYKWVFENTKDLDLPDDLSYRNLIKIAKSGKGEYWAKRIKEEGLSSKEVARLFLLADGNKTKKTYICKACGAENKI
jgi:hypothetical protein